MLFHKSNKSLVYDHSLERLKLRFRGKNAFPKHANVTFKFSEDIKLLFGKVQGGPLKSSPENLVEKRNILSLFKLPVVL